MFTLPMSLCKIQLWMSSAVCSCNADFSLCIYINSYKCFFSSLLLFCFRFCIPPPLPHPSPQTHRHRLLLRLLNLVGYLTLSVSVYWHHCFFSFLLYLTCYSDQWLRSTKSSRSLATLVSTILFTGRWGRGRGRGARDPPAKLLSGFLYVLKWDLCMYVCIPAYYRGI